MMKSVNNTNGKLVCKVDEEKKTVEIVKKGFKTVLRFTNDGLEIVNIKPT